MFDVKKQELKKPTVIIRNATPEELSIYENWKIKSLKEKTSTNKSKKYISAGTETK